jgi:hypothetical protein
VKLHETSRLLPALVGLLGIFILELMTPLGIAVWIGYGLPLWYVSRLSLKPSVSLPIVALACTGLIVAGCFLSPPGMNAFYATVNQTIGVLFLWGYTLLLMQARAADDRLNSGSWFRAMAGAARSPMPRHQAYSSNLLRKQGTL